MPEPDTAHIEQHRSDLTISLPSAMNALTKAQQALAALISNEAYGVEFVDGATGLDLAAFIDNSLRFTRASYRCASEVTDA